MSEKFLAFFLICGMLFLICFGCKSKGNQDLGDNYVPGQDMQYMYWDSSKWGQTMAEGPNGYYFMEEDFLFFTDKVSMKTVPLCNKPDCLHYAETDPTKVPKCNAYLPTGIAKLLVFWNGNLYTIVIYDEYGNDIKNGALMRISPDGTNRNLICKLLNRPSFGRVHRDRFYYAYITYDGELEKDYSVNSIDLTRKNPEEETIFKDEKEDASIQRMFCYGNGLYLGIADPQRKGGWENHRIDINTLSDTILDQDIAEENLGSGPVFSTVCNKKIYYVYGQKDTEFEKAKTVWRMDENGANKKEAFVMNGKTRTFLYADLSYLYVFAPWYDATSVDQRFLQMIDENGTAVAEVDLSGLEGGQIEFLPGEGDYLFLSSNIDRQQYFRYAVNKKELLENGSAKPVQISWVEIKYRHAQYN